jgi:type VI secretion system protein ImpB
MAKASSQKFIARNRAPRVQIEYDVELYGAEKKIQLPFVMGVMADLSGKPADPLAPVADRDFLEIDVDNFDDRLKAMKPRVAFQVPNVLTGEGNLSVDITFESMDDFSPGAVAGKVEGLNQLLKARTQLSNLLTFMDGKGGAEELIAKVLNDSALLQSLASAPKPKAEASQTDEPGEPGKTQEG